MTDHRDQRRFDAWERLHGNGETSELIPAATVVVMRDGDRGLESLMLRKNSKVAFGGMWVFPGGRIDEEDTAFDRNGDRDELATAAVAAAREAVEEASVVVDPASLIWFSHWVPPPITPKRFSTFFFAARLADDAVVTIDDGEITAHRWLRPAEAMERRDNSEIELAPPTWMTLNLLTRWQSHRLVEETLWFDRSPVGDLSTGPISKSSDRSLPPS